MTVQLVTSFIFSVLRLSTPLIYAALAAAVCTKTGLLNMAVESMMLAAALGGVLVSAISGSAWIGLLGAIAAGVLVALFISYASFIGKADLYLTNIAMNLAAVGGTVFILYCLTGKKANSAGIPSKSLPSLAIPALKDIPILGDILSGHNVLTYMAILAAFGVHFFIYRTRLGLRMRSVGENPHAAESVGISIVKIQFIAYIISGFLGALGGAFLSMGYLTSFSRNMTSSRGFIGLAASNIVNGSPIGALFTSMLFGASDAAAKRLQMENVITDFVLMIPSGVTIIALVVIAIVRQRREKMLIKTSMGAVKTAKK
jgi:simple sugar transport system permease protein